MKYVLAISGGVDSTVLLDMMAGKNVVVAHFDHGIRDNSVDDAKLVKKLAEKYQMKCVIGRGNLGKNSSEESARRARYNFLGSICKDDSCKIVTAHHQDDVIETIVINLIRGTGWRGLAPFWSSGIERPLINMAKVEIVNYAIEHNLEWVEDETNYSSRYFRNRVRDLVVRMPAETRRKLLELNQKQIKLRSEIEQILNEVSLDNSYEIKEITELPENVGLEILRRITNEELTILQLKRLLKNLEDANSGDIFQPGNKIQIGIYRNHFTVSKL